MIYNPPLDSVTDTVFGAFGGALGDRVAAAQLARSLSLSHPAAPGEETD